MMKVISRSMRYYLKTSSSSYALLRYRGQHNFSTSKIKLFSEGEDGESEETKKTWEEAKSEFEEERRMWDEEFDEEDDEIWEDFTVEDDPASDHFAIFMFSSLFGAGLGYLAFRIYKTIGRHQVCNTWPKVVGEVTNILNTGRSGAKIRMSYKYCVNNSIYRGKRIRYRVLPIMEGKQNYSKGLTIGKKIWVFYDEENPKESVLVPSTGVFYPDLALLGVVASISLAFLGFGGRRAFFFLKKSLK